MGAVDVGLGNGEIVAHHHQGGVAEDHLEGVNIATVAQVGDGEGVAETVWVDAEHAGAGPGQVEQVVELVAGEGALVGGDEERFGDLVVFARGEGLPDGGGGARADGDPALFIALAVADAHAQGFEVAVADLQIAQFGGAQAGIEEEEGNGTVAVAGGAFVAHHLASGQCVRAVVGQGFEDGFYFGLAVGEDGGFLRTGTGNAGHDLIGHDLVENGPTPQGGETFMVFEEGGFRDASSGGEEGGDVCMGEPGGWGISGREISGQAAIGVGIGFYGVGGEVARFGVEEVSITPLTGVDLFQAVGLPLVVPFVPEALGATIGGAVGWILTGLIVCRGSTVIHDLYKTMANFKDLVAKILPTIQKE